MAAKRRPKKRGKGKVSASTARREAHAQVMAKTKAGSGKRFKSLKAKIAAGGKVRSPGAVAASIGRKKYGKEEFQAMAAAGKKRKAKKRKK